MEEEIVSENKIAFEERKQWNKEIKKSEVKIEKLEVEIADLEQKIGDAEGRAHYAGSMAVQDESDPPRFSRA